MSATAQWGEGYGTNSGLRDALRSLIQSTGSEGELWRLGEAEITDSLADVAQARQLLEVAEVALVREGVERGLPSESSWSVHDWVARAEGQRAPDPSVRHVAQVARVAKAGTRLAGRYAMRAGVAVAGVREAFVDGDLPLGKADQLARFHAGVAAVADEELLEHDLGVLLAGAKDDVVATGPQGRRQERRKGLSERELAAAITRTGRLLKPEREQDDEDRRAKAARSLTKSDGPAGMSAYRVVLDAEGAAVLDSAVAALAGPVKGPDGEPDERPAPQRRADALVDVVRRGVSSPGEEPKTEKAQVVVTIGLDDLYEGTHGAGVTSTGEVLAPSVVRRMACDAGIIPVVLGGEGEVLDLGRAVRWFTPGRGARSGYAMAGAHSPAARCPRNGAMRTTWTGGLAAAAATSPTGRCCVSGTTRRCTPTT